MYIYIYNFKFTWEYVAKNRFYVCVIYTYVLYMYTVYKRKPI